MRALQGHKSPVADMAVDASGGLLASASADRSVRVWDTEGGFCTHVFTGHTCVPNCIHCIYGLRLSKYDLSGYSD